MSEQQTPQKKHQGDGESKLQAKDPVAQERIDAELVSEDFEAQPEEVIANQEQQDWEALKTLDADAARLGMAFPAPITTPQSAQMNANMSQEEQGMEMAPVLVGPPPYGSPNPLTSGSRLLPLAQHPLNPDYLPDDDLAQAAAIAGDYGVGYTGTLVGTATLRGGPIPPQAPPEASEEAAEGTEAPEEGQDTTPAPAEGESGSY